MHRPWGKVWRVLMRLGGKEGADDAWSGGEEWRRVLKTPPHEGDNRARLIWLNKLYY